MNAAIIDNVNSLVAPDDTLYFLGDFCMGHNSLENSRIFRDQIKCQNIILIFGNHDEQLEKNDNWRGIFSAAYKRFDGKIEGKRFTLSHFAMRIWEKAHRGAFHLFGHSHHSLPDDPNSLSFDVGINGWEYKPLSLKQVHEIMSRKTWKPIDHHTRDTQ